MRIRKVNNAKGGRGGEISFVVEGTAKEVNDLMSLLDNTRKEQ